MAVTALLCLVVGCGKSKENSVSQQENLSATTTPVAKTSAPQRTNDGFSELAASLIQQASKQGLQIDAASSQEALAMLIRVYLLRPDLHKAFGEPDRLNVTMLLQWAAGPGITVEGTNAPTKQKLMPYANIYSSMTKNVTALETPIYATLD
jgi:hypothetical protein